LEKMNKTRPLGINQFEVRNFKFEGYDAHSNFKFSTSNYLY
jgi:hypothetical protein